MAPYLIIIPKRAWLGIVWHMLEPGCDVVLAWRAAQSHLARWRSRSMRLQSLRTGPSLSPRYFIIISLLRSNSAFPSISWNKVLISSIGPNNCFVVIWHIYTPWRLKVCSFIPIAQELWKKFALQIYNIIIIQSTNYLLPLNFLIMEF